ncbi:MAG: hypothetical protein HKN42_11395 [Granulosicoccus sp.]|nr:hypothetical protein [Granulosicoccus sp.]
MARVRVHSRHSILRSALPALLIGSLGMTLYGGLGVAGESRGDDAGTAAAAPDPAGLIAEMSSALQTLNYEGNFVHVQGHHITSMHILHSSNETGELERLSALDGEAREVIRDHSLVTCIWPETQSVIVSKSKPRNLLPQVTSGLADNDRYRFSLGRPDRVAGLPTYVVNVMPTDHYRYGYRFWIDRESKMLLRSMMLDGPDKVVEQVMFTSIDYPASIDASRFEVAAGKEQMSWLEPKKAQATSGLPANLLDQEESHDRVGFEGLPEGYREVSETYSPMPMNEGPTSHVMLSDGMASVSVYVEYQPTAEQRQSAGGLSTMGAINAYALIIDDAVITAVGEVPAETVQAIASAVVIR